MQYTIVPSLLSRGSVSMANLAATFPFGMAQACNLIVCMLYDDVHSFFQYPVQAKPLSIQ